MIAKTLTIPVVDFAGWTSNNSLEHRRAIAHKLIEACQDVGFVYITNHQISPEQLAEAFQWSRKLFDLKLEQKMLAPHPSGFTVHRGYSWPGLEKVSNAIGDEENAAELTKDLRQVSDIKVRPKMEHYQCILTSHRKAMKSAARATRISQISGFLKTFFLASEGS